MSETTGRYLSGRDCGDEQPEPAGGAGEVERLRDERTAHLMAANRFRRELGEARLESRQWQQRALKAEAELAEARRALAAAEAERERLQEQLTAVVASHRETYAAHCACCDDRAAMRMARLAAERWAKRWKASARAWKAAHEALLGMSEQLYVAEAERDAAREARDTALDEAGDYMISLIATQLKLAEAQRWAKRWKAAAKGWHHVAMVVDEAEWQELTDALSDRTTERDAAREQVAALRPEVLIFAHLMEREFRANEHKGTWKDANYNALLGDLYYHLRKFGQAKTPEQKREYLVDVANYCLMLVDVCGWLHNAATEQGGA